MCLAFIKYDEVSIFFTWLELTRLHLHFFHPSTDKCFQPLLSSDIFKAKPEVKGLLDDDSEACIKCMQYCERKYWFRVSLPPETIIFNQEITIGVLWLDNKRVLHVICTHTYFSNDIWVGSKSTRDMWFEFLECWCTIYVGHHIKIRRRPWGWVLIRSIQKLGCCKWDRIRTVSSWGTQRHRSGDRQYHTSMHWIYSALRFAHLTLYAWVTLRVAV